jgi:hypothetical protein
MAEPSIYFSEVNERQGVFHRRAILLGAFAGLGMSALGGRLAYLQLVETQRYEKLAVSNQFNFKLIPAPRGLIVDRNGAVLAANRPNFRLMVARDKGSDPRRCSRRCPSSSPGRRAPAPPAARHQERAEALAGAGDGGHELGAVQRHQRARPRTARRHRRHG